MVNAQMLVTIIKAISTVPVSLQTFALQIQWTIESRCLKSASPKKYLVLMSLLQLMTLSSSQLFRLKTLVLSNGWASFWPLPFNSDLLRQINTLLDHLSYLFPLSHYYF